MIETKMPYTRGKIEDSPGHNKAYIELFKKRFTNLLKVKSLGEATEYFPEEKSEEEMNTAQLTKKEFITHLREQARDNNDITNIIDDIEISLEEVK